MSAVFSSSDLSKVADINRRLSVLDRTIREAGTIASEGFADIRRSGFSMKALRIS